VGVVNKLETCLSPSSAFNLFVSFNYRTLKIINRQVFPLGVMYRRFPLTQNYSWRIRRHQMFELKIRADTHRDKWFEIHVFFVCHFVL
jgi:hypothetical protein